MQFPRVTAKIFHRKKQKEAGLPTPRILLIDTDDARRQTHIHMLQNAGYSVSVAANFHEVETQLALDGFELVLVALHGGDQATQSYVNRLRLENPELPVLALHDSWVFNGHSDQNLETGQPQELMEKISTLLAVRSVRAGRPDHGR